MDTEPSDPRGPYRNPSNDSGVDLPSQPVFTFTAPGMQQDPPLEYNDPFANQRQGGLLAMMYPPLNGIYTYPTQPALASPLYGHFASPTDHEYFPYVDAGWENGLVPDREMGDGTGP